MTAHPGQRVVIAAPRRLSLATFFETEPGPEDLIVRPDTVGICRTDLELLHGTMPYLTSGFSKYPIFPGHEWTGTVIAIGVHVKGFAIGDRVVGECSIGCGKCKNCLSERYHLCPNRTETGIAGRPGALASYLVCPSRAAHRVPETVSASDAALVEPLAVAYRALSRADARPGEVLGIIGAGTIGLLAALAAQAIGIAEIHIVELDEHRRRFAADLGFSTARSVNERLPRVIDASGTTAGVAAALDLCADGGTIALLGLTGSITSVDLDRVVVRDTTINGSLGSPGVWPETIRLIADKHLQPSRLVSHRFSLNDVAAAFELVERGQAGVRKVFVHPNGSPDD